MSSLRVPTIVLMSRFKTAECAADSSSKLLGRHAVLHIMDALSLEFNVGVCSRSCKMIDKRVKTLQRVRLYGHQIPGRFADACL
jgi:hypothetical protein